MAKHVDRNMFVDNCSLRGKYCNTLPRQQSLYEQSWEQITTDLYEIKSQICLLGDSRDLLHVGDWIQSLATLEGLHFNLFDQNHLQITAN